MKSETRAALKSPAEVMCELHGQILSGACPPLAHLSKEQMVAAQELILKGEAVIVSRACRPHLTARLQDEGSSLFSSLRSLVKGPGKPSGT